MKLNYNYLQQEFANPNEILSEWKKLIKSTDYTLGHYVKKFEKTCQIATVYQFHQLRQGQPTSDFVADMKHLIKRLKDVKGFDFRLFYRNKSLFS